MYLTLYTRAIVYLILTLGLVYLTNYTKVYTSHYTIVPKLHPNYSVQYKV